MGHGVPELVLESNGRTWTLDPSRSYALGRDPQGELVFDDARVSWRHATISFNGRGWVVEDHGSTNGTFVHGQRVQQMELGAGTVLNLGNATDGPRVSLTGAQAPAGAPQAQPQQQPQQPQQQPYAAQGANAGWAQQAPPAQEPFQQQAPQQAPQHGQQHQAQQAGWQQQQPPQQVAPQPQQAAPHFPQQQGPGGAAGAPPVHGDRSPTTFHQFSLGRVMRIGRALENDLVVSDLQVSRNHAEFHSTPDGRMEIRDLGSHNGTYVNGQPIAKGGTQLLGPTDVVGVGHSTFQIVGDRLEEFVDTGEVSFSARHLTVTVDGGKQILKDVSFGVPEKSLIAVIGPSGSGKSTLLKALTGYRPADQGEVLYDNRNLYKQFAELRQRIGLVPQDDILHKELTVKKALKYAAKLRFPADTTGAERNARIDEVLRELKLDIHKDKKVTSLSGGQRKRVSVALELLTKPSLIFLDEPTSGLDPGMDRDVMQLLRGLADDGRTVLVVTHSVAELATCDKLLVMAPGGSVAYFGPPEEALNFFGYDTWADVFSAFENYRDYDWAGRWKGSQHYQMYAADLDAVAPQSVQVPPMQAMRPPKPQGWMSQFVTLVRRYTSVIASDKGFLALMVILPAVLGAVSLLIDADKGLLPNPANPQTGRIIPNGTATTVLLILAVGACFAGAANSVRELIKERVIYERERATGLSRSAYLMSKVFVLGLITVFQGLLVGVIGFASREIPDEGLILGGATLVELSLPIMALGFASMMFGLVISSLVKTAEKTMPLLVMFAIIQVVFTGCLFALNDAVGVNQFSYLMPSRWAVGAAGATLDFNRISPPEKGAEADPLWEHTVGAWGMDMAALIVLGVICGFFVARFLRRHEPEVMRK
ncbi:FHA domain-containing protein [Streptomyces sp. SID7813]|uniref:ABC transporter ATP-binding protein n=2 Tax=Streptomyces TaxID=1883 RepID=Q9AJX1_STRCO|nr:FHA domain-containing protein [Streptomyces sp. SID7813]NSL79164.1 FHA domain-containing protein [Streptomyces coelicolor]PSK49837.1 ABC transporter ATP-binding/permease protein [Streptomyces sp. 111WW2]QFI41991.1 FHA domain-containing protein [Streptomyces coelicolor A3(2)]REH20087.1 FHA modulated ABC efflux pump with fused ATPase and integral membrane subunit [Streptomyces sp. 2221.1]THA87869.1 FHA domain-containing protein [Streptomyces sp. LRa12]SDT10387.1 FHA modulated ABC efflux pump